ncbi:NAD(P)-binding protein [Emericellopsis cladophorae]|uniref:NAD(P)-binding protein n=1 Tax=Emericellopsis cladophorae TaxID=2686198 RepID=A0A9Q0BEW0_9HYPO|nr:NAD(P)-binding protein [Emericellopsis cladophorae]KAI6782286.1 NAD(P)-binding protein [Emericellopsis cladophorae]
MLRKHPSHLAEEEWRRSLAELPGVEVAEQNWVEIIAEWLRQHGVVRAIIALHNQPNQFAEESTFQLTALHAGADSAVELVKNYRKTGRKTGELDTLRLTASKDAPIGVVDADDVGTLAAQLLAEKKVSRHNEAKYVVNGPEDITGQQIVKMVEDHIGTQVKDVWYKDISFVDRMAAHKLRVTQHHLIYQTGPGHSMGWRVHSFYDQQRSL